MRIQQSELQQVINRIIDKSGSLPDDIMAQEVSKITGKECFPEDIRIYFEPTLREIMEEQRLIWQSQE